MSSSATGSLVVVVTRSVTGLISATAGIGLAGALAFGTTIAAAWQGRAR